MHVSQPKIYGYGRKVHLWHYKAEMSVAEMSVGKMSEHPLKVRN